MLKKKKTAGRAKAPKPKAKKAPRRPMAKKVKAKKKGAGKLRAAVKKTPGMALEKMGEVTHYFPHVNAAAVMMLKDSLKVGDKIYIKGYTSDFKEKVESIQLDRVPIQEGKKGQEIGLLVKSRVRIGDSVYRI